ncbi:MAG: hypothetical protein ACYC6W_10520 [Nitrosotalea sp.]
MIFSTGLITNPAAAQCPTDFCLNSDYSTYYTDHGILISIFCQSCATLGQTQLTIHVFSNSDPSGIYPTLTEDRLGSPNYHLSANASPNNIIPGYVMLTTTGSSIPLGSWGSVPFQVPILRVGIPDAVTITYGPNQIQASILSPQQTDSTMTVAKTNDQAQPTIITCPPGPNPNNPDQDGDGICDAWEVNSKSRGYLQITDATGNVMYQYFCDHLQPGISANTSKSLGTISNPDPVCPSPYKKDIFVEADYMKRHHPDQNTINTIVSAFANAPTGIPTTCQSSDIEVCTAGIRLHVQVDDELSGHMDLSGTPSLGRALAPTTDFDIIKTNYFGTADERTRQTNCPLDSSGNCLTVVNTLTAKKQIFHYALFTHSQTGNPLSSGVSELPGNDLDISLGAFTGATGSPDQQEGTFMHELGHNLGLYHGGAYPSLNPSDDSYDNCKPNYLSVMSYSRQFSDTDPNRSLNYSHGEYASYLLDERTSLNETPPPLSLSNENPRQIITYGYGNPSSGTTKISTMFSGQGIDWDADNPALGWPEQAPSNQNINNLGIRGCDVQEPTIVSGTDIALTKLQDYNDWGNLMYAMTTSSAWYDGTGGLAAKYDSDLHQGVPLDAVIQMRNQRLVELDNIIINLPNNVFVNNNGKTILHNDLLQTEFLILNNYLYNALHKLADTRNDTLRYVDNTVTYQINPINGASPYVVNPPHDSQTQKQILYILDSITKSFEIAATPSQSYPDKTVPLSSPVAQAKQVAPPFVQCRYNLVLRIMDIQNMPAEPVCLKSTTVQIVDSNIFITPKDYVSKYGFAYKPGTIPVLPTITVVTDHDSYYKGDSIIISGNVTPVVKEKSITIKILDPDNTQVAYYASNPNADGTYSKTFAPINWQKLGAYTVRAEYNTLVGETQFSFGMPPIQVQPPGLGSGMVITPSITTSMTPIP